MLHPIFLDFWNCLQNIQKNANFGTSWAFQMSLLERLENDNFSQIQRLDLYWKRWNLSNFFLGFFIKSWSWQTYYILVHTCNLLFNRTGVAGMFYNHLRHSLIHLLIHWVIILFRIFMSVVTCHMSCVMCQVSFLFLFFLQSGGASWWRVCYQRSLPRLVCI